MFYAASKMVALQQLLGGPDFWPRSLWNIKLHPAYKQVEAMPQIISHPHKFPWEFPDSETDCDPPNKYLETTKGAILKKHKPPPCPVDKDCKPADPISNPLLT